MISSISIDRHGSIGGERVPRVEDGVERAMIGFASLQFFSLIYLQKFALFAPEFALSVPMLIMFLSIGWMVVSRNLPIVGSRAAIFLIFFSFCLFSESLNQGSATTFVQLMLLYSCMSVCANLSPSRIWTNPQSFRKTYDTPLSYHPHTIQLSTFYGAQRSIELGATVPGVGFDAGFFL